MKPADNTEQPGRIAKRLSLLSMDDPRVSKHNKIP